MEIESELACPVCLENIGKINCCVTACNHTFHTSCLMQCNGLCPLCRTTVIKDTKDKVEVEEKEVDEIDDGEEAMEELSVDWYIQSRPHNIRQHNIIADAFDAIDRDIRALEANRRTRDVQRLVEEARVQNRMRQIEKDREIERQHLKALKIKDLEQLEIGRRGRRNHSWRERLWSPQSQSLVEKQDYCTIS